MRSFKMAFLLLLLSSSSVYAAFNSVAIHNHTGKDIAYQMSDNLSECGLWDKEWHGR